MVLKMEGTIQQVMQKASRGWPQSQLIVRKRDASPQLQRSVDWAHLKCWSMKLQQENRCYFNPLSCGNLLCNNTKWMHNAFVLSYNLLSIKRHNKEKEKTHKHIQVKKSWIILGLYCPAVLLHLIETVRPDICCKANSQDLRSSPLPQVYHGK
jgi:hypothetical protein